jgi:hypothetical protein
MTAHFSRIWMNAGAPNCVPPVMRAAAAIASGLLLCALPARAQYLERPAGPVATVGLLVAAGKRAGDAQWRTGIGGELALTGPVLLDRGVPPLFLGGWVQLQGVDGVSTARYGAGARASLWIFGVDAGLAQQGSDGVHGTTTYAVLAPAVQLGPGSVALRFSLPTSSGLAYPREMAIAITMRLPLLFGGPSRRELDE